MDYFLFTSAIEELVFTPTSGEIWKRYKLSDIVDRIATKKPHNEASILHYVALLLVTMYLY